MSSPQMPVPSSQFLIFDRRRTGSKYCCSNVKTALYVVCGLEMLVVVLGLTIYGLEISDRINAENDVEAVTRSTIYAAGASQAEPRTHDQAQGAGDDNPSTAAKFKSFLTEGGGAVTVTWVLLQVVFVSLTLHGLRKEKAKLLVPQIFLEAITALICLLYLITTSINSTRFQTWTHQAWTYVIATGVVGFIYAHGFMVSVKCYGYLRQRRPIGHPCRTDATVYVLSVPSASGLSDSEEIRRAARVYEDTPPAYPEAVRTATASDEQPPTYSEAQNMTIAALKPGSVVTGRNRNVNK